MTITLNGHQLFLAFHNGSRAVIKQKDIINRMNVFPVPDGDTGTNLSYTLRSGIDHAQRHESFGQTLRSIASHILMGARGNSGLLFAQFFSGLADAAGDSPKVDKESFVSAVSKAVKSAYGAITTPVEGTMLTVMREWSEDLEKEQHTHHDLGSLLGQTLERAKSSLQNTKEMLAALRKANMIDAGAKGFVDFLTGFVETIRHIAHLSPKELEEAVPEQDHQDNSEDLRITDEAHDFNLEGGLADIPFRFCTECVVRECRVSLDEVRSLLSDLGDSLIAAGNRHLTRIHIHSNKPQGVFGRLATQGVVEQQKADDMHLQYLINLRQQGSGRLPVALLTDTTCDLPDELLLRHQITTVPLTVHFGEQSWLDRYALDSVDFYPMMSRHAEFPTTSQPSLHLFNRTYQYLLSHHQHILAAHISDGLSGTGDGSRIAARSAGDRVTVLPSKTTSAALGLCLVRAAKDIEAGQDFATVAANLARYLEGSHFRVMVSRLDNFVKGGRISRRQARLAGFLNLKPIVSTDAEGKGTVLAKGFGERGAMSRILKDIQASLAGPGVESWAIAYAQDKEKAENLAGSLTKVFGQPPLFVYPISPVLGAHGGPGAMNIAWLDN